MLGDARAASIFKFVENGGTIIATADGGAHYCVIARAVAPGKVEHRA